MEFKKSRFWSFYVIAIVYIMAIVSAVLAFKFIAIKDLWLRILVADIIATAVTFAASMIFDNSSVYDPYWSVQPIVIGLFLLYRCAFLNWGRILIVLVICFWGLRLTLNWAYTFKNLTCEDWRYVMLKKKLGKVYPLISFLGIHLFPTLVVFACMLPVIYIFANTFKLTYISLPFLAISVVATIWQGIADIQLHIFRKKDEGNFIRKGLWKYSRHPNYLGEILMWWGIALAVVVVDFANWHLMLGAVINTVMFFVVSIPFADNHQARKQGFLEYKNQTRMLLPIPRFKKVK